MPKRTMPAGRGDDGWRVSGRDMTHTIPGARPAGGVPPSKSAILPNLSNPRGFSPSHNLLREFQIQKKPHCCSSSFKMAVREGFEPSIRCRIHTFQACSFSHSDTSPFFELLFKARVRHLFTIQHIPIAFAAARNASSTLGGNGALIYEKEGVGSTTFKHPRSGCWFFVCPSGDFEGPHC